MALMVARSSSIGTPMKQCRHWLALLETNIDLLDSKLSSLDSTSSAQLRNNGRYGTVFPHQEGTHRQNSQERSLASVLQPDHGDVHLGRPIRCE
jgi:hypothetical protein